MVDKKLKWLLVTWPQKCRPTAYVAVVNQALVFNLSWLMMYPDLLDNARIFGRSRLLLFRVP